AAAVAVEFGQADRALTAGVRIRRALIGLVAHAYRDGAAREPVFDEDAMRARRRAVVFSPALRRAASLEARKARLACRGLGIRCCDVARFANCAATQVRVAEAEKCAAAVRGGGGGDEHRGARGLQNVPPTPADVGPTNACADGAFVEGASR